MQEGRKGMYQEEESRADGGAAGAERETEEGRRLGASRGAGAGRGGRRSPPLPAGELALDLQRG